MKVFSRKFDKQWIYDIKYAIHEHAKGHSRYWHPDSVLSVITGRDHIGVCADLGHWVRSGLDPVDCLKKVEDYLLTVHVKDLDEFGKLGAADVRVGAGVIDYKEVMDELSRQNFGGYMFVECENDWDDNIDDVRYALEYLEGF